MQLAGTVFFKPWFPLKPGRAAANFTAGLRSATREGYGKGMEKAWKRTQIGPFGRRLGPDCKWTEGEHIHLHLSKERSRSYANFVCKFQAEKKNYVYNIIL